MPGRSEVSPPEPVAGSAAEAAPEAAASLDPADAAARSEFQRTGVGAIKRRPPAETREPLTEEGTKELAEKERVKQQHERNLRFEAAACRAPGIAERYRNLDADGRAALAARCAKAGVVLADPK